MKNMKNYENAKNKEKWRESASPAIRGIIIQYFCSADAANHVNRDAEEYSRVTRRA